MIRRPRVLARAAGWVHNQLDRRLFRIRRQERYPVRLPQRRIFVLPTPAGLSFALTLLAMLLASINYTLSLGFALTFLLAGLGLASLFHAFRNLLGLELRAGHTERATVGEPARFEIVLSDSAHRPRPALEVRASAAVCTVHVLPGGEACARLDVPTRQRGWLSIGRVTVETRYPLGLVRAWSVLTPEHQVLVYPAPEADAPAPPAGPSGLDGSAGEQPGDEDFSGLREHQAGDSPRRIAWKAVARSDTLVSKAFVSASGAAPCFDWQQLPPQLGTEARLSRLARWVLDAAAAGQRYTLVLPGITLGPGRDALHRERCLEALALYPAVPAP